MTKNQILELFPLGNPFPIDGDTRRYDPVSAAMGGVGMVGNLVGGIMGSSAAKKAAAIQQQAANAAADQVQQVTNQQNPLIQEAARNAGDNSVSAAQNASQQTNTTAANAVQGVNTATGQANNILNPYQDAGAKASGVLSSGIEAGGQFNAQPTAKDIQIDPGYAWRLQQGEQSMGRSAAARGGAVSGAAMKDLENYSQGAASQEYGNAFARFQTNRQNNFQNAFAMSEAGRAAGTQQGANLTGAARYGGDTMMDASKYGGVLNTNAVNQQGTWNTGAQDLMSSNMINTAKTAADYRTGGAAAQAAGIVGGANAIAGGIGGAVNAGQQSLLINSLKNPAAGVTNQMPLGYTQPTLAQMGIR